MADEDPPDERLLEEIEFVRNVYTSDEFHVEDINRDNQANMVVMTIHPATAGEVSLQYVCLQLHVTLPLKYPDDAPLFEIRNPRGLSENEVSRLNQKLTEYIKEEQGNPILLQLFELARDSLTNTNIPHGVCAVCLSDFLDTRREFVRTNCYHYFHTNCLMKYKQHWLGRLEEEPTDLPVYRETAKPELVCPECRMPINVPESEVVEADDEDEQFEFKVSAEMVAMQKKWQEMYNKQLAQGGIIDLEKEREKHRLPPSLPKVDVETSQAAPIDNLPDIQEMAITSAANVSQSNPQAKGGKPDSGQLKTNNCDKKSMAHEKSHKNRSSHDEHSRRRHWDNRYNNKQGCDGRQAGGNHRGHRTNKRSFQNNERKEMHTNPKSSELTSESENRSKSDLKIGTAVRQAVASMTNSEGQNPNQNEPNKVNTDQVVSTTHTLTSEANNHPTSLQDTSVQRSASPVVEEAEVVKEDEHRITDSSGTSRAYRGRSNRGPRNRPLHNEHQIIAGTNENPPKHSHREECARGRQFHSGHRTQTHHFRPSGSAHQRSANNNCRKKASIKTTEGSEGL